jgi:hypothetical protein
MNNDFPITLLPHNDKLTVDDKGRIKWIKNGNKPKNITLQIIRYDLWGNEKDGFENNDSFHVGTETLPANYGDNMIKRIVNPYFVGMGFCLSLNRKAHYIVAKDLHYIWEADDFISIEYRGQVVGELRISNIT